MSKISEAVNLCRQKGLKLPSMQCGRHDIPVANSSPYLLLANLLERIDESVTTDLEEKLLKSTCAVLYGTSGSGKTRTILEILARNPGFYFSSFQDIRHRLGSRDMHEMFLKLKQKLVPKMYTQNQEYAVRFGFLT
jgi:hypothetical protein